MRAWKWPFDSSERKWFPHQMALRKNVLTTSSGRQILTRGHAPQDGSTPLGFAALAGHVEAVQVLLEAGANKEAKNEVRMRRGGEGVWVRIGVVSLVS